MVDSISHPSEFLQFDDFLCFALYAANHAMNRAYKPLLDKIGLTYPQYIVMVVLWEKDGQAVRELGERLFLASNTLTPLLKRLEKMGYVTRQRDPKDERKVLIYLTQVGKTLKQDVLEIPGCIINATGLTSSNLEALQEQLSLLRKNLETALETGTID
ncbi:MarR family transcriptional regulator [Leptothoe sp. LEGE 181152]|uniref:MarR family transcriptional regulator n=1 Tax=Adonisia turfae CCMR0081 TaxID=2292702 RepID=A0A6M0RWJ6_9CYAN|nr:MarR family transcriptional regulator [Adonisia turfae]MDV3353411.1 MarR family transcriptional regulator [Leptothoe sp. LEGE 181152]NEZ60604.1 MarR family transcriptional regulator [Adonisia turfae CCMR0081]